MVIVNDNVELYKCPPVALILTEQGFPSILPVTQYLFFFFFFWLGFPREYHHWMARVSILRDCSCQIDAKANVNIGADFKLSTIFKNASV